VAAEIEIVRSDIQSGGEVFCKGRMVGGDIVAGTNIMADVSGDDMGVTTLLEVKGIDKPAEAESSDEATEKDLKHPHLVNTIRVEEKVYQGTKFTVLGQRYEVKKLMEGPIVAMIDEQLRQIVFSHYDEKEEEAES
jgi:hypothetical protein